METPQPIFFVNYQINIILFQNCPKNKEDKITNTYIGQNISKQALHDITGQLQVRHMLYTLDLL